MSYTVVSSFCFIRIPMSWVDSHYKYFFSYSAGSILDVRIRRQIMTSKVDARVVRDNNKTAVKGVDLSEIYLWLSVVRILGM